MALLVSVLGLVGWNSVPVYASAIATFRVDAIEFEGNRRTLPETMLQELSFGVGDDADLAEVDRGRQAILDLGLFKAVESKVEGSVGTQTVTYIVDEKHYWYVLPKADRSGDGDVTLGLQGEFTNLGGRNQTLDWVVKRKKLKDADVDEERSLELEFTQPRVGGGPYGVQTQLELEQAELDETRGLLAGEYERNRRSLGATVSRWLRLRGASQGWRVGGGLRLDDYNHRYIAGDPTLFFDATVITWSGLVEYRNIRDRVFSRSGRQAIYRLEVSSAELGSDVDLLRHKALYRRYIPLRIREHTNLDFQVIAGYATQSVFGDPTYSLGGSDTLRGYPRDSVEGDVFVQANAEFLFPFKEAKPAWRGALFADLGNAYKDLGDVDLTSQRVDVGVGVRWTLRSLVRATLRLDVGQGLNRDGDTKVFVGTRAVF